MTGNRQITKLLPSARTAVVCLLLFRIIAVTGQQDSVVATTESKWKKHLPMGQISAGYEYGLLPFLVNVDPPQGNFKSQGNIGLDLFGGY